MTVTDETSKNSTEKEENKTVTVGEENAASNTEDIENKVTAKQQTPKSRLYS